MGAAVERLARAAESGERVAVVGDYDVDGISATALLAAVFRACGLEVETILPHRMRDGYGFRPQQVERAREAGCRLIVTADCGSGAVPAVEAAIAAGIDVVVTDHHLPGRPLPAAAIHVNPKQEGCGYPFPDLSGAGLAFKLASAFAGRRGRAIDPLRLLRVACLGTISDVVPLAGENRVIASLGLEALGRTRSPGLRALFRESGVKPPLSAADVGFRLGPRLNAAGRMEGPEGALELLLTTDRARAGELAAELGRRNQERRDEQERVEEDARRLIAARGALPPLVAAWSGDWHRGVVGIAAGRLARELRRPTLLLCVEGETATGSGRSLPGIHLHELVARFRSELESFGGHSQAVGLTVRTDRLESLRARWEEAARGWDPALFARRFEYEGELEPGRIGSELVAELARLEPFGEANPRPLFRIGPLRPLRPPRLFGNGHAALSATGERGAGVELVGWGWADRIADLAPRFEVLGSVEHDRYTGGAVVRLVDARVI